VATILGLLLVVTFIANYLSTTLPNTMGQNDLQHDVEVENQVAQLSALMQVTAQSGAISAQVSQAVTLGSVGAPPFAAADSSTIAPANLSSGLGVNFTLNGPSTYAPPGSGGPLGVNFHPTSVTCTNTATSINAVGSCNTFGNLSGNSQSFTINLVGSLFDSINVTTNSSTISASGVGSGGSHFEYIGNQNTITMTSVGSSPTNISVIGNFDTLSIATVGSSPIVVYLYGNHDSATFPTTVGTQSVKVIVYGTYDGFSTPNQVVGSNNFRVFLNGFNATAPTSSQCPYANLSSTDSVSWDGVVGASAGLTVYSNNAVGYYANSSSTTNCVGNTTCLATHSRNVPLSACPFFSTIVLPISAGKSPPSAALVVHLNNVYSTRAEVALDQGAVVYAQPGGLPVFVVPPRMSLSNRVLSLFVPRFSGHIGSESGVGTADVSLRLLSTQDIVLPSNHFSFQSSTQITITIISPYVAAWYAYFHSSSSPFASYVTCIGSNSVCTALYSPGGPLGTVTLAIPTAVVQQLNLLVGLFSVNLA